jgi:hypothetical protein
MKNPLLLLSALFAFMAISFIGLSQKEFKNSEGNYSIVVPPTWQIQTSGTTTDVFAPDDGDQDEWREFLGISVVESNGVSLDQAFEYYLKEDFPAYYSGFKILNQGVETIQSKKAKWVLYSFANTTLVNSSDKSATLFTLFYLLQEGDLLYFLNGIAEESLFSKYEQTYRSMIRTFTIAP